MPVERIHSFLVHPGKGADVPRHISGSAVALTGKLFNLLGSVYTNSERECDIDISFNPAEDGKQSNVCRDLIAAYLGSPSLGNGRRIAERLEAYTTHRSGLGLLFLMSGKESGSNHKIVISRFRADNAILAEEDEEALKVEFIERVFMKNAASYKAAFYQDTSLAGGFWTGRAVDKQINDRVARLSDYWIHDFLASDFRTTAANGTRRLAVVLRSAARNAADVDIKHEITSATALAPGLNKRSVSITEFLSQFGLSAGASAVIMKEVKHPELANERFRFDATEFKKHITYRTVEMDSGAMLTAEFANFDDVFQHEVVDKEGQKVRYSTEGKVVNERLGKSKNVQN